MQYGPKTALPQTLDCLSEPEFSNRRCPIHFLNCVHQAKFRLFPFTVFTIFVHDIAQNYIIILIINFDHIHLIPAENIHDIGFSEIPDYTFSIGKNQLECFSS